MQKLFKEVQSFYTKEMQNPVWTRCLEKIREEKEKYFVPTFIWNSEMSIMLISDT